MSLAPGSENSTPTRSNSGRFTLTRTEFLHERIALLYRLSGDDTPMILLVAAIAVFALWGVVKISLLLAWALWLVAASVARYLLARLYARMQPEPDQAPRWENIFCLVSAALGTGWGLSLLFLTAEARWCLNLPWRSCCPPSAWACHPRSRPAPKRS